MDNSFAIPGIDNTLLNECFNELANIPEDFKFEFEWDSAESSPSSNPATQTAEHSEDKEPEFAKASSASSYGFPALLNRYPEVSDEELTDRLDKLCNDRNLLGVTPYEQIRNEACSISLELNCRGLLPPRFRAFRKAKPATKRSTATGSSGASTASPYADQILSNDRKLIDLHWLHCSGKKDKVEDPEFRNLFDRDEFDFDLAARLVSKNWKTEVLVMKILCLTDVDQWQMSSLMSDEIRARWNEVTAAASALKRKLKNRAHRQPKIAAYIDDFILLWIADQVCIGGPHHLIGQVHSWQKGVKPLAKSTLSPKLGRMRRWTKTI